jgi:DNA end-binding protein Ku
MARAIWTGSLTFGLVNIPVRLHTATISRDVRFRLRDSVTGQRIRQPRVASGPWPAADPAAPEPEREAESFPSPSSDEALEERAGRPREVPLEDVVRAFELPDARYVTVTEEEIRALRPEPTHTILIEEFPLLGEIDPVYFEKSYYVTAQRGAEKPYSLLLRAMERAGRVAIARFVLRTKEHLAAIRPMEDVLVLESLFYADEVVPVSEVRPAPAHADVSQRELDVAVQLIELLATTWDPSRYRDTNRERLLELIQGKAASEDVAADEPSAPAPEVADLLEALRASVEAAKREASPRSRRKRRPTG